MSAGAVLVLAVCGGGGNDTLAIVVILAVAALYLLAIRAAFRRAEDSGETMMLAVLLVVSIVAGGLIFLYPEGISGNGGYLARFVISLLATGVLGLLAAAKWREGSAGRAVFVALAGDVLIPGGLFLLFFASVGIGSGCLD